MKITKNKPALSSAAIQAALRRAAEKHGYLATRGPHPGRGNAIEFILAIDSGEVATVLISDEQRQAFVNSADRLAELAGDPTLADAIRDIAAQLRQGG